MTLAVVVVLKRSTFRPQMANAKFRWSLAADAVATLVKVDLQAGEYFVMNAHHSNRPLVLDRALSGARR